jgi:hypothetical protein
MGATQFRLRLQIASRGPPSHSLSLARALLWAEPNRWLIEDGISRQLGAELIELKRPIFQYNSDFSAAHFGVQFDSILYLGSIDFFPCWARYCFHIMLINNAGLSGRPIPWFHPRQTWFVIAHSPDRQPTVWASMCQLQNHPGEIISFLQKPPLEYAA